jgi:prepilin-type N-terminal cleavage/methylation domain-containing protein
MLPMPRRRLLPRPLARGYTVVEVLLAMTVLTIGASAVMSMQKASMQGNLDARRTDVANGIARMWMERIRKDAMSWTLPSPASPGSASNFASASLLGHAGTGWFLPTDYLPATAPFASISPGFDMLGRDVPTVAGLTSTTAPPIFCVHMSETWLVQNAVNPTDSLLRVDLRVVWRRGITTSTYAAGPCDTAVATAKIPDPSLYASLYMTTAVRANGLP